MANVGFVELAAPFDGNRAWNFAILKGGYRGFEIAAVRHAVGTNRTATGQGKFLAVIFADKSPRGTVEYLNPVDQPARKYGDFFGRQINHAKFGAKP